MSTISTGFQRAVFYARQAKQIHQETFQAAADGLASAGFDIALETRSADLLGGQTTSTVGFDACKRESDCIIVIGGDGSLLSAAREAVIYDLPILGINRGRLGFLTDVHPSDVESIIRVMRGEYHIDKRSLLSAQVIHQGQPLCPPHLAVNEALLTRGARVGMLEFDLFVDGHYVCNQHADGMIVATPTGSTAYALSAGGPIIHPDQAAILLMPLCPHRLTSRPLIVPENSQIRLVILSGEELSAYLSCDGTKPVSIPEGAEMIICAHNKSLRLVHPHDVEYFNTLRKKLHWESRNLPT